MVRRTKDELRASNYYEWLQVKDALKAKKKAGFKLTKDEKRVMQFNPTPEKPWLGGTASLTVQKEKTQSGELPTKNVRWPIIGGSFVCSFHKGPTTDEKCMLFCNEEKCPFYGKGYMRSRGILF